MDQETLDGFAEFTDVFKHRKAGEMAPMPKHLIRPSGFVGDLADWITETAYKPQPIFSLANVLAFFGAILGRKVRTESDLRSNLYCLGVGESGSGKDHSRKAIKAFCRKAGITDKMLGGEDVSSDAAILSAVNARISILFQFDEIGHMIETFKDNRSASYVKGIPVLLTKLYTSSNTTFLGREYADQKANPRRDLEQPCVCIYGTSVPSKLYGAITPDEIRDGFLGRLLVFHSEDPDPDEVIDNWHEPPAHLIQFAKDWFQRDYGLKMGDTVECKPLIVPEEQHAKTIFKAFRARCKKYKAQYRDGSGLDSLWARAPENASKVAMIIACGMRQKDVAIDGNAAAYGVELVTYLTRKLIDICKYNVSETPRGRHELKILRDLRAAGDKGLTLTQIAKKCRHMHRAVRDDILESLIEADMATVGAIEGETNRRIVIYKIKKTDE